MENKIPGNEIIPLENTEVRLSVYWWARKMENRLRLKDKSHKLGWLDGNLQHYILQIFKCWQGAVKAIQYKPSKLSDKLGIKDHDDITQGDINLAIKKCIDLSNYAMMLADNLRNILLEKGIPSGKTKRNY